jgi:hypothetical protein
MLATKILMSVLSAYLVAGVASADVMPVRPITAALAESPEPMDPVIEEPIRPLYSEEPATRRLTPPECGAISLGMLPAAMVLMSMLRFAPGRAHRRREERLA